MARKKRQIDNTRLAEDLSRQLTKRGPSDDENGPTPQRVAKARHGEQSIVAHIHHSAAGFPTAEYHWQITPVLDSLEKRGTLTKEEWHVACRYMRHYAGSRHKGPATAKLLPSYDGGMRDLEPAERAIEYGMLRARAEAAVHPIMRQCLRWLEKAAEDEWPLWQLGAMYYPNAPQATQSARAPAILHLTLAMLAAHYGQPARFSYSDVEAGVRRFRMTVVEIDASCG